MTLLTISADSHITEPGDCYVDRIDPRFRDRAPVAVTDERMGAVMIIDNGASMVPYGMVAAAGRPWDRIGPFEYVGWDELHPGGWDPEARLVEQDRDGVSAEILYPSVGMLLSNLPDADYKKACFDAYNQWIAEFQATAPDRLVGVGQTALRSVDEGIDDLRRIADLGLRGVMMPGVPACVDEGDYDDPRWDPFWQAAVDLGLPLSFHILTAGRNLGDASYRGPKMNSFLGILRANQDIVGTMVFGGVFDRVPALQVVCVEADAGWVPHWAYRADHAFERHRNWLTAPLERRPSEYLFEHVSFTFQDDWTAFRVVDLVNHEKLLWANDHPHSDATWPNSQALLAEHTAGLDPAVRDDIVWRNCARLYGLDAGRSSERPQEEDTP
ncbi:amidohydrolase family protein [Rhabdothermincola salaria]|uniref:amidohydrolase family protein n=1 Tax=Rhabdothermincola salaria TaxID=2903142 RepID=UPI001E63C76B|nr:amidohydrolase family protein [Rhabdothermincola salaria]MCD9622964.1 amidohydrolase [Rhabdothermincola salaria]